MSSRVRGLRMTHSKNPGEGGVPLQPVLANPAQSAPLTPAEITSILAEHIQASTHPTWAQYENQGCVSCTDIWPCRTVRAAATIAADRARLAEAEVQRDFNIRAFKAARDAGIEMEQQRDQAESDADKAEQRVKALEAFLDREVLPRYVEIFTAAGLGNPQESVIVQQAKVLLTRTPPEGPGEEGV